MRRELFISRLGGALWSALREDGVTVELRVERDDNEAPAGRIIKARVSSILPGIQSAFLDIGGERGAFLHVKDLILPGETPRPQPGPGWIEAEPPPGEEDPASPPARPGPIQDRLKVGRELLVQVSRERVGTKGARVTGYLGIPGRLLVLLPQLPGRVISRRIRDAAERERLREIVVRLPGDGIGFIVRTAAAGAGEAELRADAEALLESWSAVQRRAETGAAPSVVCREPGLLVRTLRETPREGLRRIRVDDEEDRARAIEYLGAVDPSLAAKVEWHTGPRSLFEAVGLHDDVERALRPRVWLKSGGYLVIEETEALVSIDVNTGRFVGRRDLEQTALRTNLEAADEIARQLRLRDLGGIIVIDLIDLGSAESRQRIVERLKRELRRDPARTKVVGMSELGLLQLTRKRTRPGLGPSLTRRCPLCSGHGRIKTSRALSAEVVHAVRRSMAAAEDAAWTVRAHPESVPALREALDRAGLAARSGAGGVRVVEDPELRPDRFTVVEA